MYRPVDDLTLRMRSVTQRQTVGSNITPGTWTFAYTEGALQNTTIITTPCGGRETYTYHGIGTVGPFTAWVVGALERASTETSSGTVLEERRFGWIASAKVSDDTVVGLPNGQWAGPDVFHALVSDTHVTRGQQHWYTQHTYNTTNYNDYFQPSMITMWAEGDEDHPRVVGRSFWYGADPTVYLPARVAREDIFQGTEVRFSERTYAAATGFTTSVIHGLTPLTPSPLVTTFTPTAAGNVASMTDAAGKTTTFSYTWGALSQVQTPLLTTTRTINSDGTVAAETLGTGPGALTTTYTYDALMRPTGIQGPGGTTPTTVSYGLAYTETARGTTFSRTYPDALGRAVRTQDADGLQTRVELDACGRVTFASAPYTTSAGARGAATAYDALGRVTSTSTLDAAGSVTSTTTVAYSGIDVTVTDALGRTTTYDYATQAGPGGGHLITLTDAAGQITTYTYNIDGALTSTAGVVAGTRTWTYDAFGRPTGETHPEAGPTTVVPDAVGNVTSLTNAAGQTLTFSYDANHRLTGRDGPGTASDVTITYDALGRVSTESVGGQVTTLYTYDGAGRPATRTDTTSGIGFTSEYTYDSLDRLTALKYPSWHVAGYAYTPSGRLTAVTWNGQPFATFAAPDDSGRLTSYTTGPVTHTLAYDDRDRPQSLTASSALGGTALQLGYTYNQVSLVTTLSDARAGHTQIFGYDALNRLTSAEGAYGQLTWTYDAAGNRTVESRPGGSLTYSYHSTTQRLSSVAGLETGTFAYDAAGRTTSATTPDGTTTYAYSPTGLLTTVTTPSLAAGQVYDASEWRVRKDVTVQGVTTQTFTLRSLGGQGLSEYERLCTGCPHRWVRDTIYAGGRPLGSFRANLDPPVIAFVNATGAASEGAPAAGSVRVTVPNGGVVPAPIVVSYSTVHPGGGTATPGHDYTPVNTTFTIPAGTPSGTTVAVAAATINDTLDEPNETVWLTLTGATNAVVGTPATLVHTIVDNDPAPTLSISGTTVGEAAGTVTLTATLSAASGYTVTATASTANGTARATRDYTATSVPLSFAPGELTRSVTIPIVNDTYAEPSEHFTVQLTGLVHATPGTVAATVTITDDDGPWVDIDPAYPGDYFARAWTPGEDTYLLIYNPHDVAVQARVTYIRASGAGVRRTYTLGARQRLSLHVPSDAFVAGQGVQGSAVVQSLDVSRTLVAEISGYAGSGWQTGEASEGVTPATTWTFAEGATGLSVGFQEWITIFNPSSQPVTATLKYYTAAGLVHTQTQTVPSGPGLWAIHVNALWAQIEHSTVVTAVGQDTGTAVPIVVERRMRWHTSIEGHSSAGQSTASVLWEFPEGGTGLFSTFIALFNPHPAAATVRLYYRHENGVVYYQDVGVPALSRITVGSPGFLPAGAYATEVYGMTHPVYAERVVYAGTNWTIGHASPGSHTAGTLWRFADGSTAWQFETYFILINQTATPASVTLTYRNAAGTVLGTNSLVIPGYLRASVWANGTVSGQDFTTEVTATQAIVAERVMYWPTGSSLLSGGGGSLDTAAETSSLSGSPPPIADSGGGLPSPYTLTEGVQGPTQQLTDTPEALVIGKPTPNSAHQDSPGGGMQIQSSGLPWYGSHLSVGKRP